MAPTRMPVAYIPHGGGPWPFVDMGLDEASKQDLIDYLRSVAALPQQKPRALLVISAHWEARVPTVQTSARPPMLYDYYGFPPASYTLEWPAPGDPALAARVRSLLEEAGFESAADEERGFDHGTFIPLKVTYPEADVPTVQLSLLDSLDPAAHLAMGRALAPLRDEGVFIVGSGMSFHDLRAFFGRGAAKGAATFDAWLGEAATAEPAERDERLARWEEAPMARACHPREEHLLPLMVVAGAAGDDRGSTGYSKPFMGLPISGFHFG